MQTRIDDEPQSMAQTLDEETNRARDMERQLVNSLQALTNMLAEPNPAAEAVRYALDEVNEIVAHAKEVLALLRDMIDTANESAEEIESHPEEMSAHRESITSLRVILANANACVPDLEGLIAETETLVQAHERTDGDEEQRAATNAAQHQLIAYLRIRGLFERSLQTPTAEPQQDGDIPRQG